MIVPRLPSLATSVKRLGQRRAASLEPVPARSVRFALSDTPQTQRIGDVTPLPGFFPRSNSRIGTLCGTDS